MADQFNMILNQYKTALLEYKVSGATAWKENADRLEKQLNDSIGVLNKSIKDDGAFIDNFAKTYEKTNPELKKYTQEIANARKKGPELQDLYEGEQEANKEAPLDETPYYTKAAAVGGILALAAVVSFL